MIYLFLLDKQVNKVNQFTKSGKPLTSPRLIIVVSYPFIHKESHLKTVKANICLRTKQCLEKTLLYVIFYCLKFYKIKHYVIVDPHSSDLFLVRYYFILTVPLFFLLFPTPLTRKNSISVTLHFISVRRGIAQFESLKVRKFESSRGAAQKKNKQDHNSSDSCWRKTKKKIR